MVTAGRNPDPHGGLRVVNLGVTNLSATGKTDLANRYVIFLLFFFLFFLF